MKFDDASWHLQGNFDSSLPDTAAGIHIGIFVAWCFDNGLIDADWAEDFADEFAQLKNRTKPPGEWMLAACDGAFLSDMLTEQGCEFAKAYYEGETVSYFGDYADVFANVPASIFHVEDSWESFEKMSPVIAERYQSWLGGR